MHVWFLAGGVDAAAAVFAFTALLSVGLGTVGLIASWCGRDRRPTVGRRR